MRRYLGNGRMIRYLVSLFTVSFILGFVGTSIAASMPETITLTIEQSLNISSALMSLDGQEKIIKDGDKEKSVKVPYQLSGNTRLAIAKNMTKLNEIAKSYNDARTALVGQFSVDGKIEPNSDNEKKFTIEMKKVIATEQHLDLTKIKISDLNLDANQIPGTVLALLNPILDDK